MLALSVCRAMLENTHTDTHRETSTHTYERVKGEQQQMQERSMLMKITTLKVTGNKVTQDRLARKGDTEQVAQDK